MNLKKSDKIIAVIGVVILIVAAIGIIMFAPDNGDDNDNDDVKTPEKYYDFDVKCNPLDHSDNSVTLDLKDKLGRKDFELADIIVPSNYASTLKNVDIYIQFTDKNSGLFGFGKLLTGLFGTDTLDVTLLDSDGTEIATGKLGANDDNITLSTKVIPSLSIGTIRAKTYTEAKEKLQDNLSDDTMSSSMTYQLQYQLDEKERPLLRPIMWLREKLFGKDTFTYTVTYNYYQYSIEDITEMGGNNDDIRESASNQDIDLDKQKESEYLQNTNALSKS